MKKLLFICLLLLPYFSFCQKQKAKIFKESKVQIINFYIDKNPNNLPILTFTIQNKTRQNIVFNKIGLILKEFKKHPTSSSSNSDLKSKELTPIAGFDLSIPNKEDVYIYSLKAPIQIISKDAATIQIRINYQSANNKFLVPSQVGFFKFNLLFITYDLKAVKSNDIVLGD